MDATDSAPLVGLATRLDEVVKDKVVVDWQNKPDAQNAMKNALEDEVLDALDGDGREVDLETLDFILDSVLQAARRHYQR